MTRRPFDASHPAPDRVIACLILVGVPLIIAMAIYSVWSFGYERGRASVTTTAPTTQGTP